MKRFCALVTLLIILCPAIVSRSEETREFYHPGDDFEAVFTVTANPNRAVAAVGILEYDHNALTAKNDKPAIPIMMDGIPEGQTIRVPFQVKPDAMEGTYTLALKVQESLNYEEENVDGLAFSPCEVTIGQVPWGYSEPLSALYPKVMALADEAFEWTMETAPQTVDDFPVMVSDWRYIMSLLGNSGLTFRETNYDYVVDVHPFEDSPFTSINGGSGYVEFFDTDGSSAGDMSVMVNPDGMSFSCKKASYQGKITPYYWINVSQGIETREVPQTDTECCVSWSEDLWSDELKETGILWYSPSLLTIIDGRTLSDPEKWQSDLSIYFSTTGVQIGVAKYLENHERTGVLLDYDSNGDLIKMENLGH